MLVIHVLQSACGQTNSVKDYSSLQDPSLPGHLLGEFIDISTRKIYNPEALGLCGNSLSSDIGISPHFFSLFSLL